MESHQLTHILRTTVLEELISSLNVVHDHLSAELLDNCFECTDVQDLITRNTHSVLYLHDIMQAMLAITQICKKLD